MSFALGWKLRKNLHNISERKVKCTMLVLPDPIQSNNEVFMQIASYKIHKCYLKMREKNNIRGKIR